MWRRPGNQNTLRLTAVVTSERNGRTSRHVFIWFVTIVYCVASFTQNEKGRGKQAAVANLWYSAFYISVRFSTTGLFVKRTTSCAGVGRQVNCRTLDRHLTSIRLVVVLAFRRLVPTPFGVPNGVIVHKQVTYMLVRHKRVVWTQQQVLAL